VVVQVPQQASLGLDDGINLVIEPPPGASRHPSWPGGAIDLLFGCISQHGIEISADR